MHATHVKHPYCTLLCKTRCSFKDMHLTHLPRAAASALDSGVVMTVLERLAVLHCGVVGFRDAYIQ